VKLITEQGYSVAEAGRNLGINANMLGRWKREIESGGKGNTTIGVGISMQAELKRLRKENNKLRLKRNINKGGNILREKAGVRYQFIDTAKKSFPLSLLCKVMQLSHSGFYFWRIKDKSLQ
jgi:transposase-like protein